jgi:hypothetical protein
MQSAGSASQRRLDVLTMQIVTSSTESSNGTVLQQQQQSVPPTLQRQHTAGSNGGMFAGQVVVITGQSYPVSSNSQRRLVFQQRL